MIQDNSRGYRVFRVVNGIVLSLITFAAFYPMYFVVIASFSDGNALVKNVGALWAPLKPYTVDAYERVFANRNIATGYQNTLFVLAVGVPLNVILTTMGAYFLSLKNMRMGGVIMFLILFTRYFSGGMVPDYLNVKSLGLLNSLWALILPGAISSYNLIIMRTAFAAVPESLIESARLDGAKHYRILFSIMMPLCMPTIAVIILYYAVGHWNSWFAASIYLQDVSKYPIQLIMRQILILAQTAEMMGGDEAAAEAAQINALIKYALIVVSSIPVMMIYPFVQKHFVKGVTVGAVKG